MSNPYDRLVPKMRELGDLAHLIKLAEWDRAVMMPAPGAADRSRAVATLESIAHARLVDDELGDLLDDLSDDESLDEVRAANIRVLKRDRDKAVKVPPDLVRALAEERGLAYQTWTEARPADDFSLLEPHLKKLVDLSAQAADAVGWEAERYDALLDDYEPDMTTAEVEKMFDDLVAGLKPVAETILDAAGDPPDFASGRYAEASQEAFCQWLVRTIGFDVERGRLDLSPHPFTIGIGAGDVRQTTRLDEHLLLGSIYAAMHETGHALYEQGLPEELRGLPAGSAASLGIHESQSRMWENHVGRSRAFTDFMLPYLKDRFENELGGLTPEEFHRGVNHPERTLIRVEADEVTYNLHLAQRFELELRLFRDELDVGDLPEAFDESMERTVGIRPDSAKNGILQDMHWSIATFGYYPTYTLGTLYAAAIYERAMEDIPDFDASMKKGDCGDLLDWLRQHVHRHAYVRPAKELGTEIIGGPLTPAPLLDHLKSKYAAIYGLGF